MAGVPTNVAQLMAVLSLNTTPFKAEAAAATGMMGATGPIAMAALGMGAVVAGVGVVATKMAGDFQSGLTSLVTGAGESQKNLKLVSAGILQMAKDTGTSTQQLISGMYMIESGGFHGAAGLKILQAAAEGAKVGSADLGTIADSVDTILKNFGENGALTATQATNALITTVANGKTHLEDLANSLSFVLPAGAAAGLGLKDVLGAMATLTSVGVPAAESATYLRQMIIALEAPSSGAKKALAGIGISADQLGAAMKKGLPDALQLIQDKLREHGITEGTAKYVAALREISGGTRQMQGMLNLMGPHLETFKVDVGKIGGAASSTSKDVNGWALVQKNMNQQFDRAKEVAQTLMIQLGQNLLPVATRLFSFLANTGLPALKNMVQWLTGTGNQFSWLRPILAGVAIVIGGALVAAFIAWAASAAAAAVATVAATWPILLIGAAIAGLVALVIYAYNNWGWFKTAVDGAKQSIGIFLGVLGVLIHAVGPAFQFAIAGMRYTIGLFFAAIGQLAGTIGNAVGGVLGWFGRLGQGIQATVQGAIHTAITTVVNLFHWLFDHNYYFHDLVVAIQNAFTNAKTIITGLWTAITAWLGNAWKTIKADAMMAWLLVRAYIIHPIEQAVAQLRAKFTEAQGTAHTTWKNFTDLIGSAVERAKSAIGDLIAAIMKPITGLGQTLFDAGKHMIEMLINGIKSMAGNVGHAAGDIAGKVASFLGFHSPTKEGPGATADTWMPNLIKMLSHGLADNTGQLGKAAGQVAGALSVQFGGTVNTRLPQLPAAAPTIAPVTTTSGGGGVIHVYVNIDGRRAAQAIVPHLTPHLRNALGNRKF